MSILIKDCEWVVTQNGDRQVFRDASVLIEDGLIAAIGEHLDGGTDEVIDGRRKALLPGLINTHTHLAMSLLRGYFDDLNLDVWLRDHIWPIEARLTGEICQAGALLGCLEMIRGGTTCFLDMYHFEKDIVSTVASTGLRAFLAQGVFDVSDRWRSAYNPAWRERGGRATESLLAEVKRIDCPRVKAAVGPHTPYTCTDETLLWAKRVAERENVLLHMHVAETRREQAAFESQEGKSEVEYLDSIGFLSPRLVAAHCTWMTRNEVRLVADRGVKVAHCPVSNLKLASGGVSPIVDLLESGVHVGVGTDGPASNNSLDMFEAMKTASLLQKHQSWDASALRAQEALDMATVHGAAALGIDGEVGSIEEGKRADLILVDLTDPNLTPVHGAAGLISNLVYSAKAHNVDTTIVDGRILMRSKQVLTIDVDEAYRRAEKALGKLGLGSG
ncbi:MAG: amidohydrolase [Candidatus Bathyarchaeia archaeon]